jgi:Spondin_N
MISHRLLCTTGLILSCWEVSRATATTATYIAEFNAPWSAATHPNAYPAANAHFSPLVGGIHNDHATFWVPGGMATLGIERMAELGSTTVLRDEVQAAVDTGNASSAIQGSGTPSPGSTTVTFDVSPDFPLVTLVTMVAPSPDWFVGVHGLDLRDGAGWQDHVTVDLFAYDAGTEEGVGFSLSNSETVPQQPIALLEYPFAASDPRLGTYTFTRLFEGREYGDYDNDGMVDAVDYVMWRDTFGLTGAGLAADGDSDGQVDDDDYNIWRTRFGRSVSGGTRANVSAAAPEPPSAALLLSSAAVGAFRQRRATHRACQLFNAFVAAPLYHGIAD